MKSIKDLEVWKVYAHTFDSNNPVVKCKNRRIVAHYLKKTEGIFIVEGKKRLRAFKYTRKNGSRKRYIWEIWPMKRKGAFDKIKKAKEEKKRAVLPRKIINRIVADEL